MPRMVKAVPEPNQRSIFVGEQKELATSRIGKTRRGLFTISINRFSIAEKDKLKAIWI